MLNPSAVSAAPVEPLRQTPVVKMTRPVILTTMIVSMKVWVIETKPWRTGCFVLAAAATIAAEPIPDSFEKMPRAMPNWIACATTAPVKPPTAAVPVNAALKTRPNAGRMPCQLMPRTTKPATR